MKTRANRSLAAALLVLAVTAALAGGPRLLTPSWEPKAPDYRRHGPAGAMAVIAAFSDFQCPSCAAAAPHLKSIQALYPDKVAVVFKHRAWDFHQHSRQAAIFSECAGKAGKFWEYHDKLFDTQSTWAVLPSSAASLPLLTGYAKELGLDPKAIEACAADPATDALVAADLKEADEKWVNSTPTFLIGGKRFVGTNQLRTTGLNRVEDLLKK
ncbi:MAG: thioredoxin domain-containing protein [Elusimicrobia bacterium]|nr:thioredoxin domain-containing protein [Elusimicrobiota bacterium]